MTDHPSVVGLGQCSLDFLGTLTGFPERDQKVELDDVLIQGGGPTATALVTLARLGIATTFLGRVGGDEAGSKIRSGLLAEGVTCQGLLVDTDATSQLAFCAADQNAGRTIFWHRGTARPLAAHEIDVEQIAAGSVLLLDGLHAEASLTAARMARRQGVTTVLDGGSWRDNSAELLPWIDHLVVSEKFARQYGGTDLNAAVSALAEFGAVAVTVTSGAAGSLTCAADGTRFTMPAFPINAVDTTGCGDVFHGGYIYGLLQAWPLFETVRFAAACAALKTRALGGRTAIPRLAEVQAFLKEQTVVRPVFC